MSSQAAAFRHVLRMEAKDNQRPMRPQLNLADTDMSIGGYVEYYHFVCRHAHAKRQLIICKVKTTLLLVVHILQKDLGEMLPVMQN